MASDTHSYAINSNVFSFRHGRNKFNIPFLVIPKVGIVNNNLNSILKVNKKGLFYSYSRKRYMFKDPSDSLNDLIKLSFEKSSSGKKKMVVFFVYYD